MKENPVFIVISPLNPDPLYKQVVDQIKDAVMTGTLEPETKLPSIREMSKELGISIITIKRAYADLEKDGYIFTRAGMGSFVADVNRTVLRSERMAEIRSDLEKILCTGRKFGVSSQNIINIIKKTKENRNESYH